jgi:hypothetical protein
MKSFKEYIQEELVIDGKSTPTPSDFNSIAQDINFYKNPKPNEWNDLLKKSMKNKCRSLRGYINSVGDLFVWDNDWLLHMTGITNLSTRTKEKISNNKANAIWAMAADKDGFAIQSSVENPWDLFFSGSNSLDYFTDEASEKVDMVFELTKKKNVRKLTLTKKPFPR